MSPPSSSAAPKTKAHSRTKRGSKSKSSKTTETGASASASVSAGVSAGAGRSRKPPRNKDTSKLSNAAAAAARAAKSPLLLLPPTLVGRPLPTLVLDTGGWTIKHDILLPSNYNNNANANVNTNATGTSTNTDAASASSSDTNINANTNINTGTSTSSKIKLSYNVIAKPKHQLTTLISNEINTIQNKSNLIFKRPLERGYTTDLATQFQIWDHILTVEEQGQPRLDCRHSFSNGGVRGGVLQQQSTSTSTSATGGAGTGTGTGTGGGNANAGAGAGPGSGAGASANNSGRVSPASTGTPVLYTHTAAVFCLHQPFTPRNILEREDEIWFRDFGFGRVRRRLGACCSAFRYLNLQNLQNLQQKQQQEMVNVDINNLDDDGTGCCCVIDSGFSLTHVVPTVDARAIVSRIQFQTVLY